MQIHYIYRQTAALR